MKKLERWIETEHGRNWRRGGKNFEEGWRNRTVADLLGFYEIAFGLERQSYPSKGWMPHVEFIHEYFRQMIQYISEVHCDTDAEKTRISELWNIEFDYDKTHNLCVKNRSNIYYWHDAQANFNSETAMSLAETYLIR